MTNMLDNGTVLPHGLLSHDETLGKNGFDKSYKNYGMKIGIVTGSYPVGDDNNKSGLTTEYDVVTIEQHQNQGATTIKYKNCMAAEGLGSIADFFEATLRPQKNRVKKTNAQDLKGQDGAIVLLLCLDGVGERGVIMGALTHPDRKTTLKDSAPHLEGEYNGIHIVVNSDGSTALTFKGATDNSGKVTDPTQGNTVITVEKDGSYQVSHSKITQRLDKNGKASLKSSDDISNNTDANFNVTAAKNIAMTASGDMNTSSVSLAMKASGSATLTVQKMSIASDSDFNVTASQVKMEAQAMATIKAASIVLDGFVALGGSGGQPVLTTSTMFLGTGNLGAPVMSQAISGFAIKVTAQ